MDISKLTKEDIGRWIMYTGTDGKKELGKLKSWNKRFIFVVYKCAGNWNNFKDYTGVATRPGNLMLCETIGEPTKADVLYEGRDYEGGNK